MINEKNMPTAYAEVLAVLEALGDYYKNKIPVKILETMDRETDKTYTRVFDKNDKNPELSREAIVLISWLNLKYWCEDEQEKAEWYYVKF